MPRGFKDELCAYVGARPSAHGRPRISASSLLGKPPREPTLYGGIVPSEHGLDPQQWASLLYAVTAKDGFFERPAIIALLETSAGDCRILLQ